MKKIEIIPTVMPTDYDDFVEKINRVHQLVDTVQIDVMDGQFVESVSWPYNSPDDENWNNFVMQNVGLPHWDKLDFEIDLMVADQIGEAKKWIAAGVARVICHVEAFKKGDGEEFLKLRDEFGVELYLALVPETSIDLIMPFLDKVDGIQFMGINKIGFQGQPFEDSILDKIKNIRALKPDLHIEIDGGVNFDTAPLLVAAGATKLASGSLIFESDDPKSIVQALNRGVNS